MYFVSITVDLFLFYPNKVQVLVSQKKKKKEVPTRAENEHAGKIFIDTHLFFFHEKIYNKK